MVGMEKIVVDIAVRVFGACLAAIAAIIVGIFAFYVATRFYVDPSSALTWVMFGMPVLSAFIAFLFVEVK